MPVILASTIKTVNNVSMTASPPSMEYALYTAKQVAREVKRSVKRSRKNSFR
jgi:hypothetical protein